MEISGRIGAFSLFKRQCKILFNEMYVMCIADNDKIIDLCSFKMHSIFDILLNAEMGVGIFLIIIICNNHGLFLPLFCMIRSTPPTPPMSTVGGRL